MKVIGGVFGVGKESSCPCNGNNQAFERESHDEGCGGKWNVLMMSIDSSQSRKGVVCYI